MGCDVRCVAQVRNGDGWKTIHWLNPLYGKWCGEESRTARCDMDRCPTLFSVMGGDSRGPAIARGRGLPEGFTINDQMHEGIWMGASGYTWMTLAEIKAFDWDQSAGRESYREACRQFWETWMPKLTALGAPEDVRLVVGFDEDSTKQS